MESKRRKDAAADINCVWDGDTITLSPKNEEPRKSFDAEWKAQSKPVIVSPNRSISQYKLSLEYTGMMTQSKQKQSVKQISEPPITAKARTYPLVKPTAEQLRQEEYRRQRQQNTRSHQASLSAGYKVKPSRPVGSNVGVKTETGTAVTTSSSSHNSKMSESNCQHLTKHLAFVSIHPPKRQRKATTDTEVTTNSSHSSFDRAAEQAGSSTESAKKPKGGNKFIHKKLNNRGASAYSVDDMSVGSVRSINCTDNNPAQTQQADGREAKGQISRKRPTTNATHKMPVSDKTHDFCGEVIKDPDCDQRYFDKYSKVHCPTGAADIALLQGGVDVVHSDSSVKSELVSKINSGSHGSGKSYNSTTIIPNQSSRSSRTSSSSGGTSSSFVKAFAKKQQLSSVDVNKIKVELGPTSSSNKYTGSSSNNSSVTQSQSRHKCGYCSSDRGVDAMLVCEAVECGAAYHTECVNGAITQVLKRWKGLERHLISCPACTTREKEINSIICREMGIDEDERRRIEIKCAMATVWLKDGSASDPAVVAQIRAILEGTERQWPISRQTEYLSRHILER